MPSNPTSTRRRGWSWPVVVFVVGVIISLLGWRLTAEFIGRRERERFYSRIDQTTRTIAGKIDDYRLLLRGGAGLFAASPEVTRREWRAYVEALRLEERFSGMQGFGFALRLSPGELAEHIRRIQAEGFTNYSVRPPGERSEYTPVIYLEPFDARNQRAFGYDMLTEPVRRAAMERARDTDLTVLSGKVTLVQETGPDMQAGFLMYVPVYEKGLPTGTVAERRAALHGYVYSPFRAKQFIQGLFPDGFLDLQLQVYDGREPTPSSLLYASDAPSKNRFETRPTLISEKVLELYGRPWTCRFSASPAFFRPAEHPLPKILLATALSVSLLFSLLVWAQANACEKARKLAEEITLRKRAEAQTREWSERLEQRVAERTAALAESEDKWRILFNESADGIILANTETRTFRGVNQTICRMLGYSEAELLRLGVADLHPGAALPEVLGGFDRQVRGQLKVAMEVPVIRKDGTVFPADITSSVIFLGGERLLLGAFRDVTERAQTAAELARHHERLEELVRARTADLEDARAAALSLMQDAQRHEQQLAATLAAQRTLATQLADANNELESFSHSVSHDLRAPLRHIHGYVEMLAKATAGQLDAKAQRYLKIITDASVEMGQLIDDLLAFSRTSRVELRVTRVDLDRLAQECLRNMEPDLEGRNIDWNFPPLPPVTGDPGLLRQVLANLLGNAVKYTRPRDPARIELGCAGEEAGRLVFFVRDNGVGFDPQYAHRLFGVFQRLHRADEFEGTGIGLANVRRIIVRHGGRVWAEGKVNEGATVYFTLAPAIPPQEKAGNAKNVGE